VSGALGCIIPIDEVTHNLLEHLSFALLDFLTTVDDLEYKSFRAFRNDVFTAPMTGFVDGDFVEYFLDLPAFAQWDVLSLSNALSQITVEYIIDMLNRLKYTH